MTSHEAPPRVLMLANPDAAHTLKWATGLARRGVSVRLLGLQQPRNVPPEAYGDVRLETARLPSWITEGSEGSLMKALYLAAVSHVRRSAKAERPDLVHAHYVSSYGLLGALARVRPLLISVWGSDVYSFPDKSRLGRAAVKFALGRADAVAATSQAMAGQTRTFYSGDVAVTPFGIDLQSFAPETSPRPFAPEEIVLGTVKTLYPTYGIDVLLRVFATVRRRQPALPLKLLIVGGGAQRSELLRLAADLEVADHVRFVGHVPAEQVPHYLAKLDVFLALSRRESFGVAALEASACGRPVVVSDVGGLPEVVLHGETGFVVPSENVDAAAQAVERLVLDSDLRQRMGRAGRRWVEQRYDFERSLDLMLDLYRSVITRSVAHVRRDAS